MARGSDTAKRSDDPAARSSIEQDRAEILRLINALRRGDTPSAGGPAESFATPARPRERDGQRDVRRSQISGVHVATQPGAAPAVATRAAPVDEAVSPAHLVAVVRHLETRLQRIEEALHAARRAKSSRPPVAIADDAAEAHLLAGRVHETVLADILQLVTSHGMTGEFVVDGGHGKYRLQFHDGEIYDADGPEAAGPAAVFAALAVEEGRFYFDARSGPPPKRTIEASTQFLVLEALRHIDEKRAQIGKTTATISVLPISSSTKP